MKKTWLNVSQPMGSLSLSVRKIAFAWRTHAVRWPDWHGTLRKIGYRCDMYARSCKLELTKASVLVLRRIATGAEHLLLNSLYRGLESLLVCPDSLVRLLLTSLAGREKGRLQMLLVLYVRKVL